MNTAERIHSEKAAPFLRANISHNDSVIEWVVVGPDAPVNDENVTEFEVPPSPTLSAIFNTGMASWIDVAHLMTDVITRDDIRKK